MFRIASQQRSNESMYDWSQHHTKSRFDYTNLIVDIVVTLRSTTTWKHTSTRAFQLNLRNNLQRYVSIKPHLIWAQVDSHNRWTRQCSSRDQHLGCTFSKLGTLKSENCRSSNCLFCDSCDTWTRWCVTRTRAWKRTRWLRYRRRAWRWDKSRSYIPH